MSLFIKEANLCLPTTKTTEIIEISYLHYFSYLWIYLKKSIGQSIGSLRLIPIPILKKKGRYRYFGTLLVLRIEGLIVQTCRSINVHVVNSTDSQIYVC